MGTRSWASKHEETTTGNDSLFCLFDFGRVEIIRSTDTCRKSVDCIYWHVIFRIIQCFSSVEQIDRFTPQKEFHSHALKAHHFDFAIHLKEVFIRAFLDFLSWVVSMLPLLRSIEHVMKCSSRLLRLVNLGRLLQLLFLWFTFVSFIFWWTACILQILHTHEADSRGLVHPSPQLHHSSSSHLPWRSKPTLSSHDCSSDSSWSHWRRC